MNGTFNLNHSSHFNNTQFIMKKIWYNIDYFNFILDKIDIIRKSRVETSEKVYHYCSISTFEKIVKGQSIRATDIRCFKDKTEFKYGIALIRSVLDDYEESGYSEYIMQMKHDLENIWEARRFVACFSVEGDLENQWCCYGDKGEGVSLGFRPYMLNRSIYLPIFEKYITYDKSSQENEIKKALSVSLEYFQNRGYNTIDAAKHIIQFFSILISGYKAYEYREEKEYRMEVAFKGPSPLVYGGIIENAGSERPFVSLYSSERYDLVHQTGSPFGKKLPIEKIIIGPNMELGKGEKLVKEILSKNGYTLDYIEIAPSKFSKFGQC